ncbi:uncharacterized protein LOC116179075 [Photinus pyralis]|uniref:Single domain-containing protein n=1 Tax=Photinus pyralis TaxID=7054 RepID=A0A1Y1L185_PHOPY|nr:uncharacterized protein LOC116179075 [Photinus pyralis]
MKRMKSLLVLLFISGTICFAHGWTETIPVDMDPDQPNVCVYEPAGKLRVGETKPLLPTRCACAACSHQLITLVGCEAVAAAPPCVVQPEDLTKPYPLCCPLVSCP